MPGGFDMTLQGRVALVTGGAGGLGSAICLGLSELGASVVVNYCGEDYRQKAVMLEEKIITAAGAALIAENDITVEAEVENLVEKAVKHFGRVDILVNCAGITIDDLAWNVKKTDLDKVLAVNLVGASLMIKACLKSMLAQNYGRIINISSIAGLIGVRGASAYSASKSGLIGLSKAVARDVARKGVTVNVICPGYFDAGILSEVKDEFLQEVLKQVPINRLGRPSEVAAAVSFLASEDAAYITGAVLRVDGGLAM